MLKICIDSLFTTNTRIRERERERERERKKKKSVTFTIHTPRNIPLPIDPSL